MTEVNVKKFILFIFTVILWYGCNTAHHAQISKSPLVDPQVKQWYNKNKEKPDERLPVLVTAKSDINDIKILKKIKDNYYTGRVTPKELQILLKDNRIKKISSGKQNLHQQKPN